MGVARSMCRAVGAAVSRRPPTEPDVSNSLIRFVSSHRLAWITPFTRQWLTQGCAFRLGRITMLHPALCRTCVDTSCGLYVPFVVPHSRTLCPASPSLQWVPCASVPHLHGTDYHFTYPRYYDPLRLPTARLGFLRFRSTPDTLHSPLLFVSRLSRLAGQAGAFPPFAWALVYRQYPFF
jgi:hypothetical protein